VLTYEMMDGEPAFQGNSEIEVYSKITRLQYQCPPFFTGARSSCLEMKLSHPSTPRCQISAAQDGPASAFGVTRPLMLSSRYACADGAVDLIAKMLEPIAEKRIGNLLQAHADVQAHQWFNNFDFQMLYDERIPAPHIPAAGVPGGSEAHSKGPRAKKYSLDLTGVLKNTNDKGFWVGW
jgi:serine/threonine protein kinase